MSRIHEKYLANARASRSCFELAAGPGVSSGGWATHHEEFIDSR